MSFVFFLFDNYKLFLKMTSWKMYIDSFIIRNDNLDELLSNFFDTLIINHSPEIFAVITHGKRRSFQLSISIVRAVVTQLAHLLQLKNRRRVTKHNKSGWVWGGSVGDHLCRNLFTPFALPKQCVAHTEPSHFPRQVFIHAEVYKYLTHLRRVRRSSAVIKNHVHLFLDLALKQNRYENVEKYFSCI